MAVCGGPLPIEAELAQLSRLTAAHRETRSRLFCARGAVARYTSGLHREDCTTHYARDDWVNHAMAIFHTPYIIIYLGTVRSSGAEHGGIKSRSSFRASATTSCFDKPTSPPLAAQDTQRS